MPPYIFTDPLLTPFLTCTRSDEVFSARGVRVITNLTCRFRGQPNWSDRGPPSSEKGFFEFDQCDAPPRAPRCTPSGGGQRLGSS